MDQVREQLLREAFLYDEPSSFIAGVEAALRAVADSSAPDLSEMPALHQQTKPA